jgi:hypothetical protein
VYEFESRRPHHEGCDVNGTEEEQAHARRLRMAVVGLHAAITRLTRSVEKHGDRELGVAERESVAEQVRADVAEVCRAVVELRDAATPERGQGFAGERRTTGRLLTVPSWRWRLR